MISTHATQSVSSGHIQLLQHQLQRGKSDTLIVCFGDSETEGYYFPPVDSPNPLVLKVEGFTLEDADEAIQFAIKNADIRALYLCGHSRVAQAKNTPRGTTTPSSSFLRNVIESQNRMRDSKRQFAELVSSLREDSQFAKRINKDQLDIVGFFYLVESGMFLWFDHETNEYQPLIPVDVN